MRTSEEWYRLIAAESALPSSAAQQLRDDGFVVMPGPVITGGAARMSDAYDDAVSNADPADVRVRASTRVSDFVNRGPEFDGIYTFPPLLAACCQIIGAPFKLSSMHARTLEPGAPAQPLHVDVRHQADGWPLVGFILMVDDFHETNGATRFVPGRQSRPYPPEDVMKDPAETCEGEVLACGTAGSIIVFNGSTWHGHTSNRSTGRRRSVQGAFIPRSATSATDHAARLRSDTFQRISDLAKHLLDLRPLLAHVPQGFIGTSTTLL